MLQLLNKNIIEYVLNLCLDYNKDILKMKQLYKYKFNIKTHIHYDKLFYNNTTKLEFLLVYFDNKKIKEKNWYLNRNISYIISYLRINNDTYRNEKSYYENNGNINTIYNTKNSISYGIRKKYFNNGNLEYEKNYDTNIGKEYNEDGILIDEYSL
jgi:antitoxin component YwqK of YwqJK toxin-antitoxin module